MCADVKGRGETGLFPSSVFNIFTSLQGEPGLGERLL